MKTADFNKIFLQGRDETGRFTVKSLRTNKTYYIEPIGSKRAADWGSYNPSTGNIEHKKGYDKYSGAIDESESLITKENGFTNILYTGIGVSPHTMIDELDSKYPTVI